MLNKVNYHIHILDLNQRCLCKLISTILAYAFLGNLLWNISPERLVLLEPLFGKRFVLYSYFILWYMPSIWTPQSLRKTHFKTNSAFLVNFDCFQYIKFNPSEYCTMSKITLLGGNMFFYYYFLYDLNDLKFFSMTKTQVLSKWSNFTLKSYWFNYSFCRYLFSHPLNLVGNFDFTST